MLTLFMLLAAAGGILRLALAWLLKQRWGVSIGVPQALAGALVVLAGLPEFIKPIPFPVPLGISLLITSWAVLKTYSPFSVSVSPLACLSNN